MGASASDQIMNGCSKCDFASFDGIVAWQAPAPVPDVEAAKQLIGSRAPDIALRIDRSYEQALAPGDYLICSAGGSACAAVHVTDGEVTTVHVVRQLSGPRLFVREPRTGRDLTAGVFFLGVPATVPTIAPAPSE